MLAVNPFLCKRVSIPFLSCSGVPGVNETVSFVVSGSNFWLCKSLPLTAEGEDGQGDTDPPESEKPSLTMCK